MSDKSVTVERLTSAGVAVGIGMTFGVFVVQAFTDQNWVMAIANSLLQIGAIATLVIAVRFVK